MPKKNTEGLPPSSLTESGRRSLVLTSTGDLLDSLGIGNPNKTITRNLYGFDHSKSSAPLPPSRSSGGFMLFTRPQLNLSGNNLRSIRKFYNLLNTDPLTVARYVRATLDPRLGMKGMKDQEYAPCPLLDNKQAFIPLISNSITSGTGWPDKVVPKFVSEPNRMKDTYQQVDGMTNLREPLTIDVNCRNTVGDPLYHMLDLWTDYTMLVHSGELEPYPDMILRNEKDYETRCFRIVLDKTNTFVSRIASTSPGFAEGVSQGNFYDFDKSKPYVDGSDEISMRFSFTYVEYEDPILIKDFNETVEAFNEDMTDKNRPIYMVKVPRGERELVNSRGYPRINPDTLEFEIWIPAEVDGALKTRNQNKSSILI